MAKNRSSVTAANVNTGKLTMQAAAAGVLGVIPMTLCMLAGPVIGLPRVSLPEMYAVTMAGYWTTGPVTMPLKNSSTGMELPEMTIIRSKQNSTTGKAIPNV